MHERPFPCGEPTPHAYLSLIEKTFDKISVEHACFGRQRQIVVRIRSYRERNKQGTNQDKASYERVVTCRHTTILADQAPSHDDLTPEETTWSTTHLLG